MVLVSEKGLVHELLALLIWIQVLMVLYFGLFIRLPGLRFFRLGRRVVQKMRRKPGFEHS